ncbi:MAG: hypothetical protein ACYC0X_26910 [Pirellulaceae bacterium]
MAYFQWTRGVCAILVLCVGSLTQADPPQLTPQPGILVLRNGRVLRGEIVRIGDRFTVTLGAHDEIGVPADSVEIHCASLEEAYHRKRDNLSRPGTAAEHLILADWCLRYELLASAAEQLMTAQRLEPENSAAALFERRLRLAAPQTPPAQTPPAPAKPAQTLLSQIDLQQFLRDLPTGTVEQFTQNIQPLLINRCGLSACHGPNATSAFRLAYPGASRILPQRFTQLNLHTVMQQINSQKPVESPLLVMATSAHGTCDQPTLGSNDHALLQQLVDWLERCTSVPAKPTNLGSPDAMLLQPGALASVARAEAPSTAAVPRQPTAGRAIEPADASQRPDTSHQVAPTADHGAGTTDLFDPEIFNRRYHRQAGG